MLKVIFISLFALVFLNGCKHYDTSLLVQAQDNHYDYHQPPVHAPAHGRRAMHAYHYYPEADFYYDDARRTYFYLNSNGSWSFSVNLPTRYRSYLNTNHVQIEMESDRPYTKYNDHKRKYKKYKRERKKDNREYRRERKKDKREYKREMKKDKREYKREMKKDKREYKREMKKDKREYKRKQKKGKYKYSEDEYEYEDD